MGTIRMKIEIAVVALALAGSSMAMASPSGVAAHGQAKAKAVCSACHGADGNKTLDGSYPKLAGQYADYLSKALHDYKSGKRKNPIMMGQAQGLSDQEIADLSEYFSSLQPQIHDLSQHTR